MNDNQNEGSELKVDKSEPVDAGKSAGSYEALVQRLAFAAINEQRRSRRWRIFFIILTFIYLTPFVLLTLDVQERKSLNEAIGATGPKGSSFMIMASSGTFLRTVGA